MRLERATPKVNQRQSMHAYVRTRAFYTILSKAKLLKGMVARDGIERPTLAFSGPLTDSLKWIEINECH